MATEVVKTIKPSGGDYSSLSAWEAGEQKNLTVMERAVCSNFDGTPFTAGEALNFSSSGAVAILVDTDNSSYIRYAVQSGTPTTLDTITGNLSAASADIDSFVYQDGEIAIAECYSMQDTTAVAVNGWTTDSTRYIKVYTPSSERHDGKWNTSKYRLVVSGSDGILIQDDAVRLEGLQISVDGSFDIVEVGFSPTVRRIVISHNILKGDDSINARHGIVSGNSPAGSEVRIYNNIIYDTGGFNTSVGGVRINDADFTAYIYNNTITNILTGNGIIVSNGTVIAKNNLVSDVGNNCYSGSFDGASDYNWSDDTTNTGGANDIDTNTPGWDDVVFAGVEDFHLGASGGKDKGPWGNGSDLSSDPDLPFSDDIDGETRSGTWDIGADEVVASVGIAHFRRRIEGY